MGRVKLTWKVLGAALFVLGATVTAGSALADAVNEASVNYSAVGCSEDGAGLGCAVNCSIEPCSTATGDCQCFKEDPSPIFENGQPSGCSYAVTCMCPGCSNGVTNSCNSESNCGGIIIGG